MTGEQRKQLLKRCYKDVGIKFINSNNYKTVVHTQGLRIVIDYGDKYDCGSGKITSVSILNPQYTASPHIDDKLAKVIDPILIKWAIDVAKDSIDEGDSILEHIDEIKTNNQEKNDDTSKD